MLARLKNHGFNIIAFAYWGAMGLSGLVFETCLTHEIERTQEMNNKNNKETVSKQPSQPKRPQEPLRPYPYYEEEVLFANNGAGIMLAGTITVPHGSGPFPAAILIAGTGRHARDAEVCGHKTMLVLSDYLTRHGIAVLRFDKRGCGISTGNFEMATSIDFASDVQAGIEYLKTHKEINWKQIGFVGHSEGGLIATMVAAESRDVAFVVILASAGVNGEEIICKQYTLLAQAEGEAEEAISMGHKLLSQMIDIVKKEADTN